MGGGGTLLSLIKRHFWSVCKTRHPGGPCCSPENKQTQWRIQKFKKRRAWSRHGIIVLRSENCCDAPSRQCWIRLWNLRYFFRNTSTNNTCSFEKYCISRNFSENIILALLVRLFSSLKLCIANNTFRLEIMYFEI